MAARVSALSPSWSIPRLNRWPRQPTTVDQHFQLKPSRFSSITPACTGDKIQSPDSILLVRAARTDQEPVVQVTLKSGVRFEHSRNRNRGRVQPRSTSSGAKTRTRGPAAKFCARRGIFFFTASRPFVRCHRLANLHSTQHTLMSMCCRGTLTSLSPTAMACDFPGVWGVGFGDLGKPFRDPCGAPANAQMRRTPLLGASGALPCITGLSGQSRAAAIPST